MQAFATVVCSTQLAKPMVDDYSLTQGPQDDSFRTANLSVLLTLSVGLGTIAAVHMQHFDFDTFMIF